MLTYIYICTEIQNYMHALLIKNHLDFADLQTFVYVDSIQLHCTKNQLSMITLYNYIFSKKTLNMYLGT